MQRVDLLLVNNALANTRTHAQRLIKNNKVTAFYKGIWQPVTKPGLKLDEHTEFKVETDDADRFVSRGAFKLLAAVIGVEVGHSQLAEKLASDPRVLCYERVNARELPSEILLEHTKQGSGFDLAVMDVSFISQLKILPSLIPLIKDEGYLISLVKPQFEVGKEGIGRGGIVRDANLYPLVKTKVIDCCESLGLQICEYFESPIKGGDGNREFLLIARKA